LFPFEVTAVIRKVCYQGLLDAALAEKVLKKALEFDVIYQTFKILLDIITPSC
jgi:hypothetical protein